MESIFLATKEEIKELQHIIKNGVIDNIETVKSLKDIGRLQLDRIVIIYNKATNEAFLDLPMDIRTDYVADWKRTPAKRIFTELKKDVESSCYILTYTAKNITKHALIHESIKSDLENENFCGFGNLEMDNVFYDVIKIIEDGELWGITPKHKINAYKSNIILYDGDDYVIPEPEDENIDNTDPQNQDVEQLF